MAVVEEHLFSFDVTPEKINPAASSNPVVTTTAGRPAPKRQAGKPQPNAAQNKRLQNSVRVEKDGGFVFDANAFTRKSMGIPDEREARYEEWCRKQESYPVLIDYERARKSKSKKGFFKTLL